MMSAASLCLIVPPLAWLAIPLLLLSPQIRWRSLLVIVLLGLILLPALQSPYRWIDAARQWDVGATAACVWIVVALSLWRWRRWPLVLHMGLWAGLLLVAAGTLWYTAQIPIPTPAEWQLVRWLQARIPDGSLVRFDNATRPLAPVVTCPNQADIVFTIQQQPLAAAYAPGKRYPPPTPDYIVTTDESAVSAQPWRAQVVPGYFVARTAPLPNPVDIPFGNAEGARVYLLGYDLLTPEVHPGEQINIRLDLQFAATADIDVTNLVLFIHITKPDQPGEKIMEYNVPLAENPGLWGPRLVLLNQHHRLFVPENTPPGVYDVLAGIFRPATWEQFGTSVRIGQLTIGE